MLILSRRSISSAKVLCLSIELSPFFDFSLSLLTFYFYDAMYLDIYRGQMDINMIAVL